MTRSGSPVRVLFSNNLPSRTACTCKFLQGGESALHQYSQTQQHGESKSRSETMSMVISNSVRITLERNQFINYFNGFKY